MGKTIRDITPQERRLLSQIRFCPALYLGEASLRNFDHMSGGYIYAMRTVGLSAQHNLLPEGLNEFTDRWYGGDMGNRNWASIIALREPDDAAALKTFFVILDAYLEELGYAPLPKVENWAQFRD